MLTRRFVAVSGWCRPLLLQLRTLFYLGDRIETQGYVGYVEEINVRSAVMRTGDGQDVHVPNSDDLENMIVNRADTKGGDDPRSLWVSDTRPISTVLNCARRCCSVGSRRPRRPRSIDVGLGSGGWGRFT